MKFFKLLFFLLWSPLVAIIAQPVKSVVDYVDPTIGTVGVVLGPALPTVHLPNNLIRVFPVRKDHLDDQISYFPLTSTSHRLFNVFGIMPYQGTVNEQSWTVKMERAVETIKPHYYRGMMEEHNLGVEFTPSQKSGIFKFHFPQAGDHFIRMGLINKEGEITTSGKRVITGSETFSGMQAYFYAEVDNDIEQVIYRDEKTKKNVMLKVAGNPATVQFRYAISYISIDRAKENLQREITSWDFNAYKNTAYNTWNKTLSKIMVEGGTLAQKRVFYTALYRCFERMVDINEYGKYYSAYDKKVHETNEPFYTDSWIYDFTVGLFPLQMIINTDKQAQFIRSYIKMYEQGGWMPSFALVDGDWPAMTGNYAAVWMADAWFKGIRNFDVKKAYEGVKKNSLEGTHLPWRNGPANSPLDSFYNKYGFIPGLAPGEKETVKEIANDWERRQAVSVTIETSYCDWAIAQLSGFAGYGNDRPLFMNRAQNYKKMYRAEKGFMWPRNAKGEWIDSISPSLAGREYYTENNAYTFNWHVRHDFDNLFNMMGGRKAAEEKLDQLFRADIGAPKFRFWVIQPDASGLVGQYVMGNEMGFFIPYLYNNLGAPWKTQKRVRMLLDTWFPDNVFGYPGDEDGGGMSPFIVFSMMGFFPVSQGIPTYNIGSPVFSKITIQLPGNKTFVINAKNNSPENKYIQGAKLNGKNLDQSWFTHKDIAGGGSLELIMGALPDKSWGSDTTKLPPSHLEIDPSAYMNDIKK
jgi:predicted alpha-1,2-mannosidase